MSHRDIPARRELAERAAPDPFFGLTPEELALNFEHGPHYPGYSTDAEISENRGRITEYLEKRSGTFKESFNWQRVFGPDADGDKYVPITICIL